MPLALPHSGARKKGKWTGRPKIKKKKKKSFEQLMVG